MTPTMRQMMLPMMMKRRIGKAMEKGLDQPMWGC